MNELLPLVPARKVRSAPPDWPLMKCIVGRVRCFFNGHLELKTWQELWPSPESEWCCMKCGRRHGRSR
jgi:hypothetical protein